MNTAPETRGLLTNVYRTQGPGGGDATNGGVSASHDRLTLVGVLEHGHMKVGPIRDLQIFSPTEGAPAVAINITRHVWPEPSTTAAIVPVVWDADESAYMATSLGMFGGNYAATTDSRWHATVSTALGTPWRGALPIHDRTE